MAVHGKFTDALVALGAYDLTGVLNEMSLTLGIDELDSTVFGTGAKGRLAGLTDADVALAGIFDGVAAEGPMFNQVGVSPGNDSVLTLAASRAEGARAFLSRSCAYQFQTGASIGDLLPVSLSAKASKVLPGGVILEPGSTARTTSGNGAGGQHGAIGATQSGYATLHVFGITGTTVSLTVEIESDDNGSFSTPVTRFTFTAVTDVTGIKSYWGTPVAGPVTDDYWRAKWTITGTGSFSFIVGFGIR